MTAIPPAASTSVGPAATPPDSSGLEPGPNRTADPIDVAEWFGSQAPWLRAVDGGRYSPTLAIDDGGVATGAGATKTQSRVDATVDFLLGQSVSADYAVSLWQSLTDQERTQLVSKLITEQPAVGAEFANQIGQASDDSTAKEFWAKVETWTTTAVADTTYHAERLPSARAFFDEIALLSGASGRATKAYARTLVTNIQESDDYLALAKSARRNSSDKAYFERARLHLDTWRYAVGLSKESPDLGALARRNPRAFIQYVDSLRGDKKAYDEALAAAIEEQPGVDYTGRGGRGGRVTDTYLEALIEAARKYGSADLRADLAMKAHREHGSLDPGFFDVLGMRRALLADPGVLSIMLHEHAEWFSGQMKAMIANEPKLAQRIVAAGVAGYTVAYNEAKAKSPPDQAAADAAAYDLGLLLGETKEAAREAFEKGAAPDFNVLEAIFRVAGKRLVALIPGTAFGAAISQDILNEVNWQFAKHATKFASDSAGDKIDDALDKFVNQMFAATRDAFWTLRDPDGLHDKVKSSTELDAIKKEYAHFVERVDAGYAAGRDGDNNAARTD